MVHTAGVKYLPLGVVLLPPQFPGMYSGANSQPLYTIIFFFSPYQCPLSFFGSRFIKVYFTHHKIHPFQQFNPTIVILPSGATITVNQFQNFYTPSKISCAQLVNFHSHPEPQATGNLLSMSVNLPFLTISCKWITTV